jgi:RNA polymerase sigma factor (sigma-70 family)
MSASLPHLLEHLDDVKAWCRRRSRDSHLAEDAAQEAALAAVRHWENLRDPTRIRGWLFKVAARRMADELRRRRPAVPLVKEPVAPVEAAASYTRRVQELKRAVRRLPAVLRKPVRMHYLQGIPLREVARDLETTVNGIKARLYRARRILKEAVEP